MTSFFQKYWMMMVVVMPLILFFLAFRKVLPGIPTMYITFLWVPMVAFLFVSCSKKFREQAKTFVGVWSFGSLAGAFVMIFVIHITLKCFPT